MNYKYSLRSYWAKTLFALTFALTPTWVSAQISLNVKGAKLSQVIKSIQKQTKYEFFYDDALGNTRVSALKVNNASIEYVLKHLFHGKGVGYRIEGNVIYLKKESQSDSSTIPQHSVEKGQHHIIKGIIRDENGEPLIGATVKVEGTNDGAVADIDGKYEISTSVVDPRLVFSYIGYASKTVEPGNKSNFDVVLAEEGGILNEVVVTAMGIQRKEKSLTYATQQVKADDLMRVQDSNAANSLEGKVAGITVTASAGGAGGASKIILRGNKSILGSSTPLIVIDGIPMSNDTRGQQGMSGEGFGQTGVSEGSDPLSMINPDDIESMNILKGANAAALYGSRAANGVIMITTKRGREGKLDVSFTSNVTFDTPLTTPALQKIYGSTVDPSTGALSLNNWGPRINSRQDDQLIINAPVDNRWIGYPEQVLNPSADPSEQVTGRVHEVHLRNKAGDDVDDFFRTGVTTNNSISLSGGTEILRTYVSLANSHANGMMRNNSYNRNSINFRQNYNLFKRLHIDVSLNYAETRTNNRPGGGTIGNPIYHLYVTPQNIDIPYYREHYMRENGSWMSNPGSYYLLNGSTFQWVTGATTELSGPQQEWAYLSYPNNNPYWLINKNSNKQRESRLFGTLQASVDIYDGLSFQARFNYNQLRYNEYATRYATTFLPASMDDYGHLWDTDDTVTELYTDYLLNYNKDFDKWSLSATAGYVAHTIKGRKKATDVVATYYDRLMRELPTIVNYFETDAGGYGATTTSKTSNWDQSYLFTAQIGWNEAVYVDASYRRDWYRPFRYFKKAGKIDTDNYGYFGFGANAIISQLVKMPSWWSFLKYRASYSEVGNSIPNIAYSAMTANLQTGALSGNKYTDFAPVPEKTKAFETGFESLFFNDRLSLDVTFYHSVMENLYMTLGSLSGSTELLNSAKVRNIGVETTIGYDFKPVKWLRWRTSFNFSYNNNTILETGYDDEGKPRKYQQLVGQAKVVYQKGGSIGDIYAGDYMRDENGYIVLTAKGEPKFDQTGSNDRYMGNMNAKWALGWSNTFTWNNLQVSFLINGRIGGKVISLTEAYLDYIGASQRSADARLYAEKHNIIATEYGNQLGMLLPDGSGRIVPVQSYYQAIGASANPMNYIYSGTNFRLRELSIGYTFRDLFGPNRNLTLSFVGRNLFFLYKDCPTDPDVSLSTTNGLGAFESFNMPSSRSYGFSLKCNF